METQRKGLAFWLLTAFYVHRANTVFDGLTSQIIEEATTGAGP